MDFRHELKHQTDAHHNRVDAAFSELDISERDGFIRFLIVHNACFSAMALVVAERSDSQKLLAEMNARIECDLLELKPRQSDFVIPVIKSADQLAIDYMIEGSRLGSQVLKRRWAQSTDPEVLGANAYFSLEPVAGRWREVCDELSSIPPDSQRAATIISETQDLFDMFHSVLQARAEVDNLALEPIQ